ncbi:MAG: Calx-beta domain-containing protein, partial [Pseudomonadota bacterium]
ITAYLAGDFDGDGVNDLGAGQTGPSFAWWSWNPNSGDTGGYVLDDWVTVRQNAADLLEPLLDADGSGGGTHHGMPATVTFDVVLDAPAAQAVSFDYETRDGTATAGADYIAASGSVSFAAGQQTAQISVQVLGDTDAEADETFTLVLTDPAAGEVTGTGTIIDDDGAAPQDPPPADPDPSDPGHGGDDGHGGGHGGGHVHPTPPPSSYVDITTYGTFHGSSSHTEHDDLHGGRTAITTEAMVAYNALRNFLGLQDAEQTAIGQWAFANAMTNNSQAYGQDLLGVGLFYAMQGAKVGWIDDAAFDPQILADIQRTARLGDPADVLAMVQAHGHTGFAAFLTQHGLFDTFVNTLKMEPHYGGWMHGRVHGHMGFPDGQGGSYARAHDVNHLTVLSHDQTQPFMNDTFDWPQWSALDVPHPDVIDYFQSMVVLGDPLGDAIPAGFVGTPISPPPADPDAPENDLDGDGTSDILWLNSSTNALGYFQMQNGQPTWQSLGYAGSGYQIEGIGTFNGDTTGDILWFNTQTRQVGLYEMAQDGSFTWRSLGLAGADYEVVGTGDFSGDGIDDILWHNAQTQQVGFYEMSAQGFAWRSLGLAGSGYEVAATGDFDGNGTDDILWLNTATRQLGAYQMDQGAFTWRSLGFAGQDYEVHGVGDFNGDDVDDILWFNTATLQVGYYAMSETDFTWVSLGIAGSDYAVAGTGDFDANGYDDILWQNAASGQIGTYGFDAQGFQWNGLGVAGPDFDTGGMMPG